MKSFPAFILLALAAGPAAAGDAPSRPLYLPTNVYTFFNPETKAELKITPAQEKALRDLEARKDKISQRYYELDQALQKSKVPEREKNIRQLEMETRYSDELFELYAKVLRPDQLKRMKQILFQNREMGVFQYPEVRAALKMSEKEARALREAWAGLMREKAAELKPQLAANKITMDEYLKTARRLSWTVPDEVRAMLTPEQQKVFADLHGEPYGFRKRLAAEPRR